MFLHKNIKIDHNPSNISPGSKPEKNNPQKNEKKQPPLKR